jgi:type II secretory pathway component PulM
MSVITDKARDFWDRISPRERNLVILAGIATPIILAIWLGSAIHDGLAAMEHGNNRARQALAAVETMRAKGETKPPVDDAVATMTTEPVPLATYITTAAEKAKFVPGRIDPHGTHNNNGFVTSSSALQIEKLDIGQLKDFLNAIETDSKVVAITKLDVSRDFRDKEKLRADLEISTYSREPKSAGSDSGSAGSNTKAGK